MPIKKGPKPGPPDTGYRQCKICRFTKPISHYPRTTKRGLGPDRYAARCKPCTALYKSALYSGKKEKIREQMVEWNYGLKPEDYRALLARTGNRCEICGTAPRNRNLAIDHDHKTGLVRGLLCVNCNVGLGRFKDGVERLVLAIAYLERHKENADDKA